MTPEQLAAAQAISSLSVLVPVLVAIVGGVFGLLKAWSIYLINSRVKDKALAAQLDSAAENSLGVIQQAASGVITSALSAPVRAARIPAELKPGVQYMLDHSAESINRYSVTWNKPIEEMLADKITSRKGLAEIRTNLAISGAATPVVASPLSAIPPTADPPIGA
jgi:hypothetical protein